VRLCPKALKYTLINERYNPVKFQFYKKNLRLGRYPCMNTPSRRCQLHQTEY